MHNKIFKTIVAVCFVLGLLGTANSKTSITIGSGSTSGLYYPTVNAIAQIINSSNLDLEVKNRSTGAAVFNCRAIGQGQLQMGLSQNNIAYYAYHGKGVEDFEDKPAKNLRGLAVLYPEVIHILAHAGAGINSPADLKDKRVYVGDVGSGTEQDAINILSVYDLELQDLKAAIRGSIGSAVDMLRNGRIDAIFYTVGVGSQAITSAAKMADIKLVPMDDKATDTLKQNFAFYTPFVIPGNTYPRNPQDTSTITLSALLVADAKLDTDDVYAFMDTLFNKQLDSFYNQVQNQNIKEYFQPAKALDGMSIPLHPGAIKFYQAQNIQIPDNLK